MTKVTEFIRQAEGNTLFSIEMIPPLKGQNINELLRQVGKSRYERKLVG